MHYQKITLLITEQNKTVAFSTNTDRNFKYVKKIVVFTSPTLADNRSTVKMSRDFKIDGKMIYPVDFDLYLLHPLLVATEKDFKYQHAKAEGSTIEGEITDTGEVGDPYHVTILLCLDNEPSEETVVARLHHAIDELKKMGKP